MCLPLPDVDRFYKVWKSLLFFANDQYHLITTWKDATLETSLRSDDVIQVRDHIWQDNQLLDRFITQNPTQLSDADLSLVDSWRHRRQGDFILLKILRKHAIFIAQDHSGDMFAVKGLYSTFSEILPYAPILVKTVLLPYEHEIISDGLYQSYQISFGGGITRSLNASYSDANERDKIIFSLLPTIRPISIQERISKAEATNRKVLASFEKHLLRTGSSLKIVERDMAIVRQFARESLENPEEPRSLRDLSGWELPVFLKKLPASAQHNAAIGLKRFIQFMRDTERMNWEAAEDILLAIKLR